MYTGIRVVKAYVREDYEDKKFSKASYNVYKMFVKAEKILSYNAPLMQFAVYSCILLNQLAGCEDDRNRSADYRRTDESSYILYEYSDEPDDAVHGICYGIHECGECRTNHRGSGMRNRN